MASDAYRQKEHPHTYMVQDRSNGDELARLRIQDQMTTRAMGGPLPEQTASFERVLDVGCGTGGWLIELARAFPDIKLLVGVDVSGAMLKTARAQAEAEGVNDRVEFQAMDALRMIEFPQQYFDLVNHRLCFSFLRTWDWPNLLQEYQRVARSNGIIRITEGDIFAESNSAALNQLSELGRSAFENAGHLFTPGRTGVTSKLPELLHQQGIQNVQTRLIHADYHPGTEQMDAFADNLTLAFRTMLPFLRKWTNVPNNYEQLYQQALNDMKQSDFTATAEIVTVWGSAANK